MKTAEYPYMAATVPGVMKPFAANREPDSRIARRQKVPVKEERACAPADRRMLVFCVCRKKS